ncbi:CIC11C00000002308 [Sungouiella intermedia]|uniref:CIC11C00000001977 n=1 Tax=Sungouiella intermedia TaxID=45354 RepID=A0A1L0C3J8_9ASCO|nr:CIC11C00000002308 [[Candida] intermedia]SGZ58083.1 CIC11C00000001977 [[Candida] intermedia]
MENSELTIYLGSIPFDYTEEQVADIAKSVGPVTDLKLMFDPTTGRSKGSAFVRYSDRETALSAVRNLNNMNVGNRYLRCTFASDSDAFDAMPDFSAHNKLPPLPLGVQLYQNQNAQQAISSILSQLDLQTAGNMLKEARTMSLENPLLMKKLLDQCPQLSHALVETSLMVNVTTKDLVQLCLNRRQPDLDVVTFDHVQLLRLIDALTEEEIAELDSGKQKVVNDIKYEISKGSYGIID